MQHLIALLFLLSPTGQAAITWSLQITDPQFELTHLPLPSQEYKAFLPKTSWRCWFGPTQSKTGGREFKSIRCNYSVKKTGQFTTWISCSPTSPHGESKLELFDERKNLAFQLLTLCRHQP